MIAHGLSHGIANIMKLKEHLLFRHKTSQDIHQYLHAKTGLYSLNPIVGLKADIRAIGAWARTVR